MPKLVVKHKKRAPKKTTSKSTWKAAERNAAKMFGAERTPLSGSNSKITSSDTTHDKLFIEVKLRAKSPTWDLYQKTKKLAAKENKIPLVLLKKKNCKGFLLILEPQDLEQVLNNVKVNELTDNNDPDND